MINISVHEQVNDKAVAFIIQGTKHIGRALTVLMKKFLDDRKKHKQQKQIPDTYKGKQTEKRRKVFS